MELAEVADMPLLWGGWIIRPTDAKARDSAGIPNAPGIYAMYTKHGDLMYIGRSVAMNSRLRQHSMRTIFTVEPMFYSCREVPEEFIRAVEVAHIKALRPPENGFMEAGSPALHDQMVTAIEHIWRGQIPAQNERLEAYYRETAEQIAARL